VNRAIALFLDREGCGGTDRVRSPHPSGDACLPTHQRLGKCNRTLFSLSLPLSLFFSSVQLASPIARRGVATLDTRSHHAATRVVNRRLAGAPADSEFYLPLGPIGGGRRPDGARQCDAVQSRIFTLGTTQSGIVHAAGDPRGRVLRATSGVSAP